MIGIARCFGAAAALWLATVPVSAATFVPAVPQAFSFDGIGNGVPTLGLTADLTPTFAGFGLVSASMRRRRGTTRARA